MTKNKNPYKTSPAPKSAAMKQTFSISANLPKENEPATQPMPDQSDPFMGHQPSKIFPVRMSTQIFGRLNIASATEGVRRGRPWKKGVSNTTIVNEAIEIWLDQNGY